MIARKLLKCHNCYNLVIRNLDYLDSPTWWGLIVSYILSSFCWGTGDQGTVDKNLQRFVVAGSVSEFCASSAQLCVVDSIDLLSLRGPQRQSHAQHVLAKPDKELDVTTQKFRKIFQKDLAFAASTGFASPRIYATLRAFAFLVEADVQASERLNKTISLYGDRCPSGSIDLCSGRLCSQHFLGLGGYGFANKRRFKDVKDTASLLMRECLAGWALLREVEKEDRFAPVCLRKDIPSLLAAKKQASRPLD